MNTTNTASLTGLAKRLVQSGLITEEHALEAKESLQPLVPYIVENGFASGGDIAALASREFSTPLFDLTAISMVIGDYLEKPWLTSVEPSELLGPDQQYR